MNSLRDVPEHVLREISNFFEVGDCFYCIARRPCVRTRKFFIIRFVVLSVVVQGRFSFKVWRYECKTTVGSLCRTVPQPT